MIFISYSGSSRTLPVSSQIPQLSLSLCMLSILLSMNGYNSKEVLFKETDGRENKATLFSQEFFSKIQIISYIFKFLYINSDHHVHCGRRLNGSHSFDLFKSVVSIICGCLQFLLHSIKVILSHFLKYLW